MIRVLLADDHPLFREGVKGILEARGGFSVVAEASHGEEAVQLAADTRPDVAVLDIVMPGWGALEATREIKRRCRRTRVLILTAHREDHLAVRCLKAGADGYLTKQAGADQLVAVLHQIHGGGRYASSELAARVVDALVAPGEQPLTARLSDREYQVMCRMASGQAVSTIAAELHLSVQTIGTYRGRVLQKLGLKNNLELIAYALEAGLGGDEQARVEGCRDQT
ncbi:MAG TPA: response regulator transcription factor [Thermoanaerobaculia bacterium]|nr:response regulator transcription factor [Thermoanaerobaculia bacterium]